MSLVSHLKILFAVCFVLLDARNPITTNSKTTAQHKTSKTPDTPHSMYLTTSVESHQNTPRSDESAHNRNGDHGGQRRQAKEVEEERPHPYTEYTERINKINPWLSACDLAGEDPPDLRGCPSSQGFKYVQWCPESCRDDAKLDVSGGRRKKTECLSYLKESHKDDICKNDGTRGDRYEIIRDLRLRHCCHHSVANALAPGTDGPLENVLEGGNNCKTVLAELLFVDDMTARIICAFEEVIGRFDCRQTYSVVHNCSHCLDSYRKWVCSVMIPYFAHDSTVKSIRTVNWTRIRPCRSVCYKVEQTCPYLVPTDRAPALSTQYAGEGTFLCQDPEIPEAGEQAARSLHGNKGECCYRFHDIFDKGIRANCSEPEWKNARVNDSPTAPNCTNATSPNSSVSSGQEPFCGQGRVGAILRKNAASSPSWLNVQRFVWIWLWMLFYNQTFYGTVHFLV